MENPFRRNKRPKQLNVVQEVGRDPLRIPQSTPISESVETAQRLSKAKRALAKILPQPIRDEYPTTPDIPKSVSIEQTIGTIGIESAVNTIELLEIPHEDQSNLTQSELSQIPIAENLF